QDSPGMYMQKAPKPATRIAPPATAASAARSRRLGVERGFMGMPPGRPAAGGSFHGSAAPSNGGTAPGLQPPRPRAQLTHPRASTAPHTAPTAPNEKWVTR